MAATAGLSLTLDPMGKMFQNASSLKPLGQLKPNCPGNDHWKVLYKFLFFMPIGNPRWPPPQDMGKYSNAFFSETTNMIKAKLYMNAHWMVIYKVYNFYTDSKSKMAATTGHNINTGPYGKTQKYCLL